MCGTGTDKNGRNFADDILNTFSSIKVAGFELNLNELCSKESNWQQVGVGSGLKNIWRQTIIRTVDDSVHYRMYDSPVPRELTHPPLDKMAAISQTTFSGAFSWMKSLVFWFEFHWILFILVQIDNKSALIQAMAGAE